MMDVCGGLIIAVLIIIILAGFYHGFLRFMRP